MIVAASPMELSGIHDLLESFWRRTSELLGHSPDRDWRLQFETALREIGANIARHAYGLGAPCPMRLRLRLYSDRVEGYFTDQGIAFTGPPEPHSVLDNDAVGLPEGGYGLAIARSALDRITYRRSNGGTNSWRLVKRLPG